MGALTIDLSSDSGSATVVSGPEMTLGETTTIEKAAGTAPETSTAVPQVTAENTDGFGPQDVQGKSIPVRWALADAVEGHRRAGACGLHGDCVVGGHATERRGGR